MSFLTIVTASANAETGTIAAPTPVTTASAARPRRSRARPSQIAKDAARFCAGKILIMLVFPLYEWAFWPLHTRTHSPLWEDLAPKRLTNSLPDCVSIRARGQQFIKPPNTCGSGPLRHRKTGCTADGPACCSGQNRVNSPRSTGGGQTMPVAPRRGLRRDFIYRRTRKEPAQPGKSVCHAACAPMFRSRLRN